AAAEIGTKALDLGTRRQEDGDTASLRDEAAHRTIIEEIPRLLLRDGDVGLLLRIERTRLEHLIAGEIVAIEGRIDGGREPDEAAADALAEGEAELELGGGLVDLVDHDRVARTDESFGQPPAGDPGRHDHDIASRRLRRRFALAIDDTGHDRRLQDRLR